MSVTLYEKGEVYFRFLCTSGFHVKPENERFTSAGSRSRQNLKYENFTSSFGRLREEITPKIVLHDYFSLVQPIMFLICDVVVAVTVVVS